MIIDFKKILEKSLQEKGIDKSVEAANICSSYDNIIDKVAGKKAKENSKALYVKNRVLVVAVTSSSWACDLNLRQVGILNELNRKTDTKRVERINFKIMN